MIDIKLVRDAVERSLESTDMFLVELTVDKDNRIVVEVDSMNPIDIDSCATLSRNIEERLDRDAEDFELEVGSAGLTSPFKVKGQYDKNIGNQVEVLTADGRKFSGVLSEADDEGFTVDVTRKVKREGVKKPVMEIQSERLPYNAAKSVKYVIDFK